MDFEPNNAHVAFYAQTWTDRIWMAIVPNLPKVLARKFPSYRRVEQFVDMWVHGDGKVKTAIGKQLAQDPKMHTAFGRPGSVLGGFRLILGDILPPEVIESTKTKLCPNPTVAEIAASVIIVMTLAQAGAPFRE